MQVLEYFQLYAKHFELEQYINYGTEVLSVTRAESFTKTGQWEVCYRDKATGEETTKEFDGVLVCTGHHADKYVPEFPGLKDYQGKVSAIIIYWFWMGALSFLKF